ncbi:hypothetical protein ACWXVO_00100 [Mycoplasma sp. 1890]
MKKSNKILLTLASISIPFITAATVISCSSNNDNKPSNPKIDDQKKPQDPKKKKEGKEQEKKPEIKHLGKTLPEGRTEDEDTKDTLVSPSLPEVTPDPKEDELLSNLTDEEIEEMFKLESLQKSLQEIETQIKEEDLIKLFNSLKERGLIKTPDTKKDDITPKISPEAQKIQNEIKINEDEIDKKIVELETISKSELNDLKLAIEDAEEQIENLTQSKVDDPDNAQEYEELKKEYEDLKTESQQRKQKVEELLNYKVDKSEFPKQIAELEQERTDVIAQIEQIKMDLQEEIIDKKNAEELIKIFEENKSEINKRIDLYKNLSVSNLIIEDIDNQIAELMKKSDPLAKEKLEKLNKKKDLLYKLRKEIKELIDKISQEQLQLEKYL